MNPLKGLLPFFMIFIFLLAGCSGSFDEVQKEAQKAVKEVFQEQPKDPNQNNKDIEYYLPFGYEVVEENPNNIILKNGAKRYILFYNQHEDENSDVVLKTTTEQKNFDVQETFKSEGKLGYFLLKKGDNKVNELTIGIGGVKITSEVKSSSLKNEAVNMMKIANSVKMKK